MKKIQRQDHVSVIQPPSVGPMMGAAMMPRVQNAIALPCSLPGNSSSSTACESGCKHPPVAPCRTRKTMSMGRLGASPHSRLDSVKPAHGNQQQPLAAQHASQPPGDG